MDEFEFEEGDFVRVMSLYVPSEYKHHRNIWRVDYIDYENPSSSDYTVINVYRFEGGRIIKSFSACVFQFEKVTLSKLEQAVLGFRV